MMFVILVTGGDVVEEDFGCCKFNDYFYLRPTFVPYTGAETTSDSVRCCYPTFYLLLFLV